MSGVSVCLFVINYLAQRCHKLWKAYHTLSISPSPLTRVGQRFYNFVPVFQKLSKRGTEIAQACDSCRVSGFCGSIALAFILGVELFYYVVDGVGIAENLARGGGAKWGTWPQDRRNKHSERHVILSEYIYRRKKEQKEQVLWTMLIIIMRH